MSNFDSDHELITSLNKGDRSAFEFIYRTHVNELYRYAHRNIKVREDCQEIIQDVFESLWARHKDIRINTIRFYLLNMVKYKVIRYFQHKTTKLKYAEHFKLFEAIYESPAYEEHVFDAEQIQALIEQSISKLPGRCQVAFRLRLAENLTNSEIASRMNIKKDTVENYMIKALQQIRSSYQSLYKAG